MYLLGFSVARIGSAAGLLILLLLLLIIVILFLLLALTLAFAAIILVVVMVAAGDDVIIIVATPPSIIVTIVIVATLALPPMTSAVVHGDSADSTFKLNLQFVALLALRRRPLTSLTQAPAAKKFLATSVCPLRD